MHLRGSIPFAVAALFVFAGCTGGPSSVPAAAGAQRPITDMDLLDEESGAVQGYVHSEELLPIAGALVALRGTAFTNTTDANGFFLFRNVPPGTYVLDVAMLGFGSSAKNVDVEVARVSNLEISLPLLAVADLAYLEVVQKTGVLECAMGAFAFVAPCTYAYRSVWGNAHNVGVNLTAIAGLPPDLQDNRFWLNFTVNPGAEQIIAELVWTASSAAATQLQLFILCGDFDYVLNECTEGHRYGVNTSTSPVRVDINQADKDEDGNDNLTKGCPDSKFCATSGRPVWWANDVAMPFYNPEFAFQQRFDVYDSIFYNGMGPDGYSIVPDG